MSANKGSFLSRSFLLLKSFLEAFKDAFLFIDIPDLLIEFLFFPFEFGRDHYIDDDILVTDLAERHGIDFLTGTNLVTWFSLILYE